MHAHQYLQWDSHHNLVATYTTKTVCTKPEILNKEVQYLRKAVTKCKCPKLALGKVERKFNNSSQEASNMGNTQGESNDKNKPSSHREGLYQG